DDLRVAAPVRMERLEREGLVGVRFFDAVDGAHGPVADERDHPVTPADDRTRRDRSHEMVLRSFSGAHGRPMWVLQSPSLDTHAPARVPDCSTLESTVDASLCRSYSLFSP